MPGLLMMSSYLQVMRCCTVLYCTGLYCTAPEGAGVVVLGHHDHGLEAGHLLAAEAARAAGSEAGHDLHHQLVVVLGLETVRGHQTPHPHLQLECSNVSTKIRPPSPC